MYSIFFLATYFEAWMKNTPPPPKKKKKKKENKNKRGFGLMVIHIPYHTLYSVSYNIKIWHWYEETDNTV